MCLNKKLFNQGDIVLVSNGGDFWQRRKYLTYDQQNKTHIAKAISTVFITDKVAAYKYCVLCPNDALQRKV